MKFKVGDKVKWIGQNARCTTRGKIYEVYSVAKDYSDQVQFINDLGELDGANARLFELIEDSRAKLLHDFDKNPENYIETPKKSNKEAKKEIIKLILKDSPEKFELIMKILEL